MGSRVQGVLVRARPAAGDLDTIEQAFGFRLFELKGASVWLLDLDLPAQKATERAILRAARGLAPAYVDAVRVLACDDEPIEQLTWLAATAAIARQTSQPTLGFVSDDSRYDFAALSAPDGIAVIGDRVEPYLVRWEGGDLSVQPTVRDASALDRTQPPEELALIPSITILPAEALPASGYPLHGNVAAELYDFAPTAIGSLGISSPKGPTPGTLTLVEARGLASSCWDAALAPARVR